MKLHRFEEKTIKHCTRKCAMDAVNAAKMGLSVEEYLARPDEQTRKYQRSRIARVRRKALKAAVGTKGRTIWISRNCKMCKNPFITQSSSTGLCCSKTCTKKNRSNKALDKEQRRRARKHNAPNVEYVRRLDIFMRDGWKCYLCTDKTPIGKHLKAPHPKSASLDHVIPLSKGGDHTKANLRTAHFICNSRKSDMGGYEQLALIG